MKVSRTLSPTVTYILTKFWDYFFCGLDFHGICNWKLTPVSPALPPKWSTILKNWRRYVVWNGIRSIRGNYSTFLRKKICEKKKENKKSGLRKNDNGRFARLLKRLSDVNIFACKYIYNSRSILGIYIFVLISLDLLTIQHAINWYVNYWSVLKIVFFCSKCSARSKIK